MGLVRWWPFTANTNDKTANKANLQNVSGVTIVEAGKLGKCASFSGSGSSGRTPNPLIGKNVFSICCWVKPNSTSAWSDIFGIETSEFRLEKSSTDSYIIYGTSAPIASGATAFTAIPNAAWSHIAIVCNGTKWYTYFNGVLDKSGNCTANALISGAYFYIGQRGANNAYWAGSINDFRIYDHALSIKEVKEISKGLMLHYNFNNVVGTNVRDSSGFENHASIPSSNAPTYATGDSGMGSASFLFANEAKQSNGNYQYITSVNNVRIPEAGTISYYFKYEGTENSDNKYAVGFKNFCSMNNESRLGMIYISGGGNITSGQAASVRDGKWHMHTFTWNNKAASDSFKNYLDGVPLDICNMPTLDHAGTFRKFIVGSAWETSYGGHSGYLDDIRVYATELSPGDVTELYQVKGSVAKNGKLFINEIAELGFNTKTAYDATWARIFYHNNKSGTVLFSSNKNELLYCNTADKKSNLWALDEFKNKDGKIELLLEYEGVTGYNRWKQSSNFTKDAIAGYEAVQISWTAQGWGGLAPSADSGTWVDGSPTTSTSSWWYAIGCKSKHETGIPGPGSAVTGAVSLWARIDNLQTNRIDKRGVLYTNEIVEVENCSMKTKTEHDANWVRIFYHNSQAGTVLFNKNNKAEFLKCSTADKQSDLWALEQFRGKDGKFELMLQYQNTTGYNRWKQSSNFTKEKIAGYEAVTISWTANYWGGLETDGTNTFVDGSVNHGNWFYAIGPFSNYSNGMPGPNGAEAGWVEIWVRCDDINLFRMIKNGKCKATEFIEI